MELTFEVAGSAFGLKKNLLLLPHSMIRLDAETGASLSATELPKKKHQELVDAVFLEKQRLFVIACASNKLAVVSESSVVSSDALVYQQWPVQPIKLLSVPHGHPSAKDSNTHLVVVVGENGSTWLVSLLHGQLPASPTGTKSIPTTSLHDGGVVFGACVNGSFITVAKLLEPLSKASNTTGNNNNKNKASKGQASKGHKDNMTVEEEGEGGASASRCVVLTWSLPHIEGIHSSLHTTPHTRFFFFTLYFPTH